MSAKQCETIRVGMIGCGNIAQHAHIPALRRTAGMELAALADPFDDLAAKVAAHTGIAPADTYSDYRSILERQDIDAVVVCALTPYHAQVSIEAMQAGKHVLVEKPMAVTADEARAMVKAQAATKKVLMVAFNHTYDLAGEYVKGMLEREEFGHLIHAEVFFYDDTDAWDAGALRASLTSDKPKEKWWPDDPKLGLLHYIHNYDSHVINLMRYLLGEPNEIEYCRWAAGRGMWAVLDYAGFKAFFKNVHTRQRRFEKGIEICGQKRRAIIELAPPLERYTAGKVTVIDAETQTVTSPLLEFRWPFEREHEHFAACVREGKTPRTNGAFCVNDVAIAERMVALALGE